MKNKSEIGNRGNEIARLIFGTDKDYDKKEATDRQASHEESRKGIRPGCRSDESNRKDSTRVIPIPHGEEQQSAVPRNIRASSQHESGGGEAGSVSE